MNRYINKKREIIPAIKYEIFISILNFFYPLKQKKGEEEKE
jgi:hypothetical protein